MKKSKLYGSLLAMTVWLLPLGQAGAWGDGYGGGGGDSTMSVTIPVWNFEGTWAGKANVQTDNEGYLKDVDVTMTVPTGSEIVDAKTGMAHFKAYVTFRPPFGTGKAMTLLAAAKTKAPDRYTQGAMVMWSGNGVMGCSMGTEVFLPDGSTPTLLHGCLHFTSDALTQGRNAAITDFPAMAVVDLIKQQ